MEGKKKWNGCCYNRRWSRVEAVKRGSGTLRLASVNSIFELNPGSCEQHKNKLYNSLSAANANQNDVTSWPPGVPIAAVSHRRRRSR